MNKVKVTLLSIAALVGTAVVYPTFVSADAIGEARGGVNAIGGGGEQLAPKIEDIINMLLFILGAIAVVMIVIGGIRYATSGGDSSSITSAKNTILYAVVGLVVAILAYAIVNFVLDAF